MIATTGHTWEQVRNEWDLPRLDAWTRYCDSHPPLRAMVQAYLGIKSRDAAEPTEDLVGLLASLPNVAQSTRP